MASNSRIWFRRKIHPTTIGRLVLLVAGILVGQAVLYGPSLIGRKILLPLDILASEGVYLPKSVSAGWPAPHDRTLSDLVFSQEPARRFIAAEFRAGRWPIWAPYQYGGVPVIWPKFSPFWLLTYWTESPVAIAWSQLLVAILAGVGAYQFFSRVLGVGFWPAVLASWCYPLTAFFVLWQGYYVTFAAAWLPWMLLAVDETIRRRKWYTGPSLAFGTALTLISGAFDIALQVLLVSALYAIWCSIDHYHWRKARVIRVASIAAMAWVLGFALAAPHVLTLIEYSQTGSRIRARANGHEDRPPVGLAALPATVIPDIYGSTQAGSVRLTSSDPNNQMESASAFYIGLIAALLVAPLAWCSRAHRSINTFWLLLTVLSLAWALNLPGFITVFRLPGLNLLSHNRLVFAGGFAWLAMTATGLEILRKGEVKRRWWFSIPIIMTACVCLLCVYLSIKPPIALRNDTELFSALKAHRVWGLVTTLAGAQKVRSGFLFTYITGAVLSGLALSGWAAVLSRSKMPRWFLSSAGALLMGDLLWFAYGRSAQTDPKLYYPPIPALDRLSTATPGRVVGYRCFPPTLSSTRNVNDIRGYDGVDPARLVEIMTLAADPRSTPLPYALTQWYWPSAALAAPGRIRLHPVLDMLNVRYAVVWTGEDFTVLTNERALPRVFVPETVVTVEDDRERLRRMARADFDPSRVAYAEVPLALSGPSHGTADIVHELPTWVEVSARVREPSMLVLADRWDEGWRAYLNAKPVSILRVDHALRGVQVPAGESVVDFRYEPASFVWGLRISMLSLLACAGWLGAGIRFRSTKRA